MTERLITPSSITAWLDCAHFLTLKHEVEDELREKPSGGMGSFARLLMEKGMQHEATCLAEYEAQGKSIFRVPEREYRETLAAWVERVGDPFGDGYDVIYQMPFVHDGIRGIADFLVRVVDGDGVVSYEPVDAKLARKEAKPGHVLQLCFYVDAIEARTGTRPARMHLWLGSGTVERLAVDDFGAYWRRMRRQLAAVLDAPASGVVTTPEPCNHCAFCEFALVCDEEWRAADSLIFVAGLRSSERAALEGGGVSTVTALAGHGEPVEGLRAARQEQVRVQADLQVQARADLEAPPPFLLIEPGDDATWGHGFEQLPEPDDGDVFLDFEGHPFWRANRGLFFLFGLIERDSSDHWVYRTWWAHSVEEEAAATQALIDHLAARRASYPGMHVYHYNHTERSSMERLATEHGVGEVVLTNLVETGAFVDLLVVAKNALQVGAESYGLKSLERLTSYERGHEIDQGAGAVVQYEAFMVDGDRGALDRIAAYNEDDVRATHALRDWLLEHRPADLPWRAAELEPEEEPLELDEQVERLHAHGPGTDEHLLGDLLGYWRRELQAHLARLLSRCEGDIPLLDDPEVLAELVTLGPVPRFGVNGNPLEGVALRMRMPAQRSEKLAKGNSVVFAAPDGGVAYSTIDGIDREAGEVDLKWSDGDEAPALGPSVVVKNDWIGTQPKPDSLSAFAARVLDPSIGTPNPVALALLRRDLPRLTAGHGPKDGRFSADLDEMLEWAPHLDCSYVAVQGPPGTGKTFRGAHLVRSLLAAGKRVGITAVGHHAIDNLLDEVVEVLTESGGLGMLRAVRKVTSMPTDQHACVRYTTGNKVATKPEFNLVAGTTWLFARDDMTEVPVDVLIIDEAGQLSLADALAASRSAHNVVLLGDPLQLPQVVLASHPGGAGRSVLEHVLGEHSTMPSERGVFLDETRRMHPDVCSYISDEIYEGRLTSHESCWGQATELGTGLRWLPATHDGRATESEEEAEIVRAAIAELMGTPWTDQHGVTAPLTPSDFLVVAPYKDQVALVRAHLDDDPRTRGVAVGTVDKFQGRQAAVVFFTMATSTAADMSRGGEFLFSSNRFNVAISRARCLAYVVCTEELLNSRGRTIEEMRLLSTICAFVERAT